jgi:hypothetical protein
VPMKEGTAGCPAEIKSAKGFFVSIVQFLSKQKGKGLYKIRFRRHYDLKATP